MKLLAALAFLSVSLPAIFASVPHETRAAPPSGKFKIKTQAVGGTKFDGLFMESYHTGAAMSAPTFGKTSQFTFKFNGTEIYTNIGNGVLLNLAFGQTEDLYAGWGNMVLNVGESKLERSGFMVNDDGYIINKQDHKGTYIEWSGWRACVWVHEVPELFWDPYGNDFYPSNCGKIRLIPVPA